jgi:hypothetical protein
LRRHNRLHPRPNVFAPQHRCRIDKLVDAHHQAVHLGVFLRQPSQRIDEGLALFDIRRAFAGGFGKRKVNDLKPRPAPQSPYYTHGGG